MARIAIVQTCVRTVAGALMVSAATLGSARADVDADDPFVDADSDATSWHAKTDVDAEPSAESWIGGEGYRRVASLYSGVTWAPLGNLRQDGLRLRIITGQSLYKYAGRRYDSATDANVWQRFTGVGRFMDLMAGWQFSSSGGTTVKVFAGIGSTTHLITPFDPETAIQGTARGPKAALEIWHNWTPKSWTSVDVAAARAHNSYSAQLRSGWRADPNWSLGPEAAVIGHSESTSQRLGLFARYENLAHEFTISGGVSRARGDIPTGYGTAQYLRRF